jgi:energy-coupling factor transporter ATP-binding protein EcfA2
LDGCPRDDTGPLRAPVQITRVSIKNFRCFGDFAIDLLGESRFLIGENAICKSCLTTAIARALGRERVFDQSDFLDPLSPIDIQVTLTGLNSIQLGVFAEVADFVTPTALTVGVLANWDPDAEEIEVKHGYPTKGWKQSNRAERDSVDLYWIPDAREPQRLLQLGARRGLINDIFSQVDLSAPIAAAIDSIKVACGTLASVSDLQAIMTSAGEHLKKLVPAVGSNAYGIDSAASTQLEVLRQLQLMLTYGGPALPLSNQSSGLAQLTLFAFSLLPIAKKSGAILLIDEPELSLHPQSQRALLRVFQSLPNQIIVATHSASLLDRANPQRLVRLYKEGSSVKSARPTKLSNEEAARLARYTTPQNAEAFFSRAAILVEGVSDKYAIEALALRTNRNLDAEGISIVSMHGAGGIATFLKLLGQDGLKIKLIGLCDAAEESDWAKSLESNGHGSKLDRAAMASLGFFVCDKDLEDVLITAVGEAATLELISNQGDAAAFKAFAKQPAHSGKTTKEQLHDFIHSRGRHVTYAPLFVEQLDLSKLPPSLESVINAL